MDKETLSKYGWVVIVIIVLVILMSFATPFGQYFSNSTMAAVESFGEMSDVNKLLNNANAGGNAGAGGNEGSSSESDEVEVITNYTIEQIEADTTMYAIGANKEEYVVADFNDDFTEVVITKNTEYSDGVMTNFTDQNESCMTKHKDTLLRAYVKNGITNLGTRAFVSSHIESISLPNTLIIIDSSALSFVDSLTTVNIPDSVTKINQYAFYRSSVVNVSMPTASELVLGKECFKESTSLKEVIFTNDNQKITLEQGVFDGCTSVEKVTFMENSLIEFKSGGRVFYNCTSLKECVLPKQMTNSTIYASSFEKCSTLSEITLPKPLNSDTLTLDALAFGYCTNLSEVYSYAANVSIYGIHTGYYNSRSFLGCTSYSGITFV